MNKRLGYLIFSLFLYLTFASNVWAAESGFEVGLFNLNDEVVKGNYVDLKLIVSSFNNDEVVDYCALSIENDSNLEFDSIQSLNSWSLSNNNISGNQLNIKIKNNQEIVSGMVRIANIRYVVKDNGTVRLGSVDCYNVAGNKITLTDSGFNVLEIYALDGIKDITLKSLKINNGELNPHFAPMTFSYNINDFQSNSLSLEYELNDIAYQDQVVVTVNDKPVDDLRNINYELSEGNDAMVISITIANTTTYNIFVHKSLNMVMDSSLKSVTINGQMLELVSGKYDYVHTVSDDVTAVAVSAELNDNDNFAFGSSSNAPATFELSGKSIAIINVVPKNSQSGVPATTYTFTIMNESYSSDVSVNPDTSDVSMYAMGLLLVLSLLCSIVMYQKNINSYK